MRLAVFGSTGATGQQFVERALAAGNQVVVYARDPSKLQISNENLDILQGELTDSDGISKAIGGADVVISFLGPRGGS